LGEDGELSFAGLHESFLQVPASGVLEAVKKVWASLYSPGALSYRRHAGLLGEEAAMAVLCQEVINSRASGVAHSLDLEAPASDTLVIYAYPGLGAWSWMAGPIWTDLWWRDASRLRCRPKISP